MKTSVAGYPRIGSSRELKVAVEQYFRGKMAPEALLETGSRLRRTHWQKQMEAGIDGIPSNDFSFYDQMLDTAVLLNAVPQRYRDLGISSLDTYFAMARGYQGPAGDVKALAMKKWFNTNYHYLVPEIDSAPLQISGSKPFDEFLEARSYGIETKPVLIGPFTFLTLSSLAGGRTRESVAGELARAYAAILARFHELDAAWVQLDEPALVRDLDRQDIDLFLRLYESMLPSKGRVKVLLQTYFGDIRDCYEQVAGLDIDAVGLDFVEGKQSLSLVKEYGFPKDKLLLAGVVNGKNIWRNHYSRTLALLADLKKTGARIGIGTSCSLLHVPYTVAQETKLPEYALKHFSFAEEKLQELRDLSFLFSLENAEPEKIYQVNDALFQSDRIGKNAAVQAEVFALKPDDFTRFPSFEEREKLQKTRFRLPLFPTTTIGSFPQTAEVRSNRAAFRKNLISGEQYRQFNFDRIKECISLQEKIGLDVLVHGEFERNDMVEYFGEHLQGFLFTEKAWVQSYGTRCVKPPIVWEDVSWMRPITVEYAVYAQSLTNKPVKGMLTGPVTILNWSFPREDVSLEEQALQIALAVRKEVLTLEEHGIGIIQIDEAALKEKLPLRRSDWHGEYLDWAIPSFRLVHSGVRPETQIHTHMCYSEFAAIIREIDSMDADVITFEASRSNLDILDALKECGFKTEIGPGVYDIHSPRIPGETEIMENLHRMLRKILPEKLWVNPDCGLKTRGNEETIGSLKNMTAAARALRTEFQS